MRLKVAHDQITISFWVLIVAARKDLVTGFVYTQNVERTIIPAGPDGSLGDSIIISGLIYRKPKASTQPIGTFDIAALTTSVNETSQRRSVSIELSFNKKYARRSWIANLKSSFARRRQAAELSLGGIETFPLGGGLLDRRIEFGVTTGTGPFIGVAGTASITYDPTDKFFTYRFDLI